MADFGMLIGGIGQSGFIGRAIVGLELDTKKYQAELAAANAQTTQGTQSLGQKFSALGGIAKAGLAAGGVALVAFAATAVKAASDLGEQINKSNVVFGANAKEMEAWSKTGAQAFGLAQSESLAAASTFGQMLDAAGLATDETAKMSQGLVELGGDLASFNNINPTEALDKLRAGLAGEAEPLRVLGVFLNEARVEAEAYRSGIAKVGDELTEGQKIQARYNIILQDTTKAQGDFERTSDSLPNQMRTLRAEFINLAASVGEVLVPALADMLGVVNDLVGGPLRALADQLSRIVTPTLGTGTDFNAEQMEELRDRAGELADQFINGEIVASRLRSELDELGEELGTLITTRFAFMNRNILPVTNEAIGMMQAKVGLAEQGIVNLGGAMEKAGHQFDDGGKGIVEFANMTGDALKDWKLEVVGSLEASIFALEDLTTESGITAQDFISAHRRMEEEAAALAQSLRQMSKEKWINEEYVKFLVEQGPEWVMAFGTLTEEQQRKAQDAWEATTEKTNTLNDVLKRLIGVLKELDGKTTHHKVRVEYEYAGYDPTKPGMPGVQRAGTTGQGTNIVP